MSRSWDLSAPILLIRLGSSALDHRGDMSFSSRHFRSPCSQRHLSLLVLTLIACLRSFVPCVQSQPYFSCFHAVLWKWVPEFSPHFGSGSSSVLDEYVSSPSHLFKIKWKLLLWETKSQMAWLRPPPDLISFHRPHPHCSGLPWALHAAHMPSTSTSGRQPGLLSLLSLSSGPGPGQVSYPSALTLINSQSYCWLEIQRRYYSQNFLKWIILDFFWFAVSVISRVCVCRSVPCFFLNA